MDISYFLRKVCVIRQIVACNYLVLVWDRVLYHIPPKIYHRQGRFVNVCVKTFTDGHALKYLQSPRSDKNGGKKGFPTKTPVSDRFLPF